MKGNAGVGLAEMLSFALFAAAAAWIVRQVGRGFVVTTLGQPWLGLPESARSWLAPLGIPFVRGPVGTLLLALQGAPGVILASRRIRGASWYVATLPEACLGVGAILAASYRFIALLACVAWLVALYRRRTSLTVLTGATLVVAACAIPFDVTLRIRPGPPAVVPTTSGCLTMESVRLDIEGDLVIVGGYEPAFFEPAWVVVW
jgi:hypothetical protein